VWSKKIKSVAVKEIKKYRKVRGEKILPLKEKAGGPSAERGSGGVVSHRA
jgi:hypothetical protein